MKKHGRPVAYHLLSPFPIAVVEDTADRNAVVYQLDLLVVRVDVEPVRQPRDGIHSYHVPVFVVAEIGARQPILVPNNRRRSIVW